MVGIVLVSHSRALAVATRELVLTMTGPDLPLAVAAGIGENRAELGTDAMEILQAIRSVLKKEGVLLLIDMGSALLSAETALAFLEEEERAHVHLCAAPFVEGAVVAGVSANLGLSLEEVAREAGQALKQKSTHLEEAPVEKPSATAPLQEGLTAEAVVRNPHGLHARPAARLIQAAAQYGAQAEITLSNATTGKGPVSARSLSSVGGLEVLEGHTVRLGARGPRAEEALRELKQLIESGLGEKIEAAVKSPAAAPVSHPGHAEPVGGGLVIGPAFFAESQAELPPIPDRAAAPPAKELSKLETALAEARQSLAQEGKQSRAALGAEKAAIFEAQLLLLDDPALLDPAIEAVRGGENGPKAWRESVSRMAEHYRGLQDEYLRQRAADVIDIGRRVLAHLGVSTATAIELPEPGILVIDDLAPSQTAALSKNVLGVLCRDGGRTSHSAVLLRGSGLPALVQARSFLKALQPGQTVAFDGATGQIWIAPDAALRERLQAQQATETAARAQEEGAAVEPAITRDGHHVEILANIGSAQEAALARSRGAEGIGLLRTEFLFLDREAAPDEEEQAALLKKIFAAAPGPIVVRTLDAGGDKELPYLHLPAEANPFLGVRALRLCLRRPELFQTQLRALLRAGHGHDVRLLIPMVSDVGELHQARAALHAAHAGLEKEKVPHLWPAPLGIMIEIPSAALLAAALAAETDFFSIGTNDLTQYTLAADRGNAELSALQDALHPAVLKLIAAVVEAAHARGRKVAVCGEAAGDPVAAQILVGLGVDELSMAPARIPTLKARLREMNLQVLRGLAAKALAQENAAAVRGLLS